MKRSILAVLVISVLVAASPASAETTRAQYIAQADPICLGSIQSSNTALAGFLPAIKHADFKKAGRKFRNAATAYNNGVNSLAGLEMPAADSGLLGGWIQALRAEYPLMNNYAKAIASAKPKRVAHLGVQLLQASAYATGIVHEYDGAVLRQADVLRSGVQPCDFLSGGGVPQLDGLFARGHSAEPLAVVRECHSDDIGSVAEAHGAEPRDCAGG